MVVWNSYFFQTYSWKQNTVFSGSLAGEHSSLLFRGLVSLFHWLLIYLGCAVVEDVIFAGKTENMYSMQNTHFAMRVFSGTACTLGSNYPVSIFSEFRETLFPTLSCLFPLSHIIILPLFNFDQIKRNPEPKPQLFIGWLWRKFVVFCAHPSIISSNSWL